MTNSSAHRSLSQWSVIPAVAASMDRMVRSTDGGSGIESTRRHLDRFAEMNRMARGTNPNSLGNLRKGGGRKKGSVNKHTTEEREFARRIVFDKRYQEKLQERAFRGKLAPAVECMLWDRACGKVKEQVEHSGVDGEPLTIVFGGRHRPEADA